MDDPFFPVFLILYLFVCWMWWGDIEERFELRDQAVEYGCAEYDSETGDFQWIKE